MQIFFAQGVDVKLARRWPYCVRNSRPTISKDFNHTRSSAPSARNTPKCSSIAQVEKTRQRADAKPDGGAPVEYDGFRIVTDSADNRVRFFFDTKPDERTRSIMKSSGFRWSPSAGAWQRQFTGNGLYAARRVAHALAPEGPSPAPVPSTEPVELTLSEFAARFSRA